MPKRSRIRGATLAAALLLGSSSLASCSDNPAPEPLASDTPSATATATATPSPTGAPALPPEARGTTRKSAVAFVRHWVDTLNYSADTLDTKHLRELSAPGCDVCFIFIDRIDQLRADKGRLEGDGWNVRELSLVPGQPAKAPVLRALVDIAPQVAVIRQGGKKHRFDGARAHYTFNLERHAGAWRVAAMERAV